MNKIKVVDNYDTVIEEPVTAGIESERAETLKIEYKLMSPRANSLVYAYISAVSAVALLAGCVSSPVKIYEKEPYPVYLSIPTSPAPPVIDKCDLMVDKLTDGADDGTVAQAYKHDMMCLRGKIKLYEEALAQYGRTSEAAAKIEAEIKADFEKVLEKYRKDLEAAKAAGEPK